MFNGFGPGNPSCLAIEGGKDGEQWLFKLFGGETVGLVGKATWCGWSGGPCKGEGRPKGPEEGGFWALLGPMQEYNYEEHI